MKIQRLTAENFKSFDRLNLKLGDFNVFIGANASGKTNVLNILEFLRDIATSGLKNAVSMQGDVEFLRNVSIGAERGTRIEVVFQSTVEGSNGSIIKMVVDYELLLEHSLESFEVAEETAQRDTTTFDESGNWIGENRGTSSSEKGEMEFEVQSRSREESHSPITSKRGEIGPQEAMLETMGFLSVGISGGLRRFPIYDFDTRIQRKTVPIIGKSELEEDGSNVALVLKNIIEDEEKRRRFINLIQYVLPFVSDVDVERFAGRSLMATLEETHAPETYLPASLLSEGTIKVISLLIALYFEDKPVIAFEEPASNLHPHLISRVVEMMKEQSKQKQIFVTTHSPGVIKHAGLENVYLVSRDESGFSKVTKPVEKEEVRIFLENEMGIEDLFVQDLLGV